jgi:hypothetical protein
MLGKSVTPVGRKMNLSLNSELRVPLGFSGTSELSGRRELQGGSPLEVGVERLGEAERAVGDDAGHARDHHRVAVDEELGDVGGERVALDDDVPRHRIAVPDGDLGPRREELAMHRDREVADVEAALGRERHALRTDDVEDIDDRNAGAVPAPEAQDRVGERGAARDGGRNRDEDTVAAGVLDARLDLQDRLLARDGVGVDERLVGEDVPVRRHEAVRPERDVRVHAEEGPYPRREVLAQDRDAVTEEGDLDPAGHAPDRPEHGTELGRRARSLLRQRNLQLVALRTARYHQSHDERGAEDNPASHDESSLSSRLAPSPARAPLPQERRK